MNSDVFSKAMQSAGDSSRAEHAHRDKARWRAEGENAAARVQLCIVDESSALLLSQHEPVHSLGINRDQLRILLRYVRGGDVARMNRELAEMANAEVKP